LEALRGGGAASTDHQRTFVSSDENATTTNNNHNQKKKRKRDSTMGRATRQAVGNLISGTAFVASSVVSLLTDRRTFKDRFIEPLHALRNYLQASGVDTELSPTLNRRLAVNLCLLGRVHMHLASQEEREGSTTIKSMTLRADLAQFWQEAKRYMRYATAVYGQSMIHAAQVDARGTLPGASGFSIATREAIGRHIDVPKDDIVVMDVDYAGDCQHLRHMVVVDHKHKKVVLSIRGTFNLDEIIKDAAAFSKEFCGGEAHSEMATMAEGVWKVAGPTVKGMLNDNDDYELILTGHSLGAGTACLLMIMLETKNLLPAKQKMRCFAYAAPPVFTPLEFVPKSVEATTNFIHQNDAISFLSVHTVRQLFQQLRAVDAVAQQEMTRRERYQVLLGTQKPPPELIATVVEAAGTKVKPKEGAPVLSIPAKRIFWLKRKGTRDDPDGVDDNSDYGVQILKSRDMLKHGIRVDPDMLLDHFPPRYEHAFDHVRDIPTE
jgi:hypothetical protein